jgi:tRNA threonylcarbamoyladenosine biosynthesis protein TsaB
LKITPSDFTEVICGVGPGSYTGIRVGASIALSFSFAQEIKLIGVSSLQAYEPQEEGAFISVIDAKMGGAYISINDGPPQVVTLEDFKKHAQTVHQILSPVVESLKSKLGLSCVTWYEMAPSASKMLALSKGPQAQISNDSSLELMYLQAWKPS